MVWTPKLTRHAVQRCAEMGISTKVAKRIIRNANTIRPTVSNGNRACLATCEIPELRDYAVVFYPTDPPIVLTVVFRTDEQYIRVGTEYVPSIAKEA